jgi:hypothetical protein
MSTIWWNRSPRLRWGLAVSAKISLVKSSCFLCNTAPDYCQCVSPEQSVRLAATMPGVAEKARFYLERSVPQLREWEEKEIFSKVSPSPSALHRRAV